MLQKNIKVLMVVASVGGGGAERVAVQLANMFSSKNNDVLICYWNEKDKEYSIDESVAVQKISNRLKVFSLAKIIDSFKPDILLSFTDVSNVTCYFAKLIARENVTHISTIHSDLRERDRNLKISIKRLLLRTLHKHACNSSQEIVTVSEGARLSLSEYYNINIDKLKCIYNPVLNDIGSSLNNIIFPSKTLKIVAAGRLTQAKNYPLLLTVARKLVNKGVDFSLDIYGEGELWSDIENQIFNDGLSNHVKLQGFVPDLSDRLKDYDVFLMTSSWEGFGNVLVEALYSGLRVISTDCPSGPREILVDGMFGNLIALDSPDSIVDVIVNRDFELNIDKASLNKHLNKFTLKTVGEEYLSLFDKYK